MGSAVAANGALNIRTIAVVGAGPSSLAVIKYLLAEEAFQTIDVFEQQSEVGGVWNHSTDVAGQVPVPQLTPNVPLEMPIWPKGSSAPLFPNPMYDQLNTNIPKGLMCYSDLEFPSQSLLFPTREDVQSYLVEYSQDIRHLIRFSTQVEEIRQAPGSNAIRWELTSKSTITNERECKVYDAVVTASGHYSVPYIPRVCGIEAFNSAFPSVITHSKSYRAPEPFSNKKVIVIGSAASGLDIGTQISKVCKKPMLNSVHTSSPLKIGQESKEEVPPIIEFIVDNRAVKFEDGRIETGIDSVVYCTGYLYSYPFLKTLEPPLVTDGRRVRGLYNQLFHIKHPTLAFTALSQKIIPFPLSESQGAVIAKVWSGKLALPSRHDMESWEAKRVEDMGDGTSFHVLGYPADSEYINHCHDWIKDCSNGFAKEPPYWKKKQLMIREQYLEIRRKFNETGGKAQTMAELGFDYELQDD